MTLREVSFANAHSVLLTSWVFMVEATRGI